MLAQMDAGYGQGVMEGQRGRNRICPTPTLAASRPPFPQPCSASNLFLGAPAAGPAPTSHCQGKGPEQGPIFAAFEPVILSLAQCLTSAGTVGGGGGCEFICALQIETKAALEWGGHPRLPLAMLQQEGRGRPDSPPPPSLGETQPLPSCSSHHNV